VAARLSRCPGYVDDEVQAELGERCLQMFHSRGDMTFSYTDAI
jgi:hypothetical protein